jgi:hypothetical protein
MDAVDSRVLFRVVGNLSRQAAAVVMHSRCFKRPPKGRSVLFYHNSPHLQKSLSDSWCRRLLHECGSAVENQKCDAARVSRFRQAHCRDCGNWQWVRPKINAQRRQWSWNWGLFECLVFSVVVEENVGLHKHLRHGAHRLDSRLFRS